jgi:hypothetical protein
VCDIVLVVDHHWIPTRSTNSSSNPGSAFIRFRYAVIYVEDSTSALPSCPLVRVCS